MEILDKSNVMSVDIHKIVITNRLRKAKKAQEIAESIKQVGLLNPITVDRNFVLIAGHNRLEACRLLGRNQIECNVRHDLTGLNSKLAEIDENLVRDDLTVLEQATWLRKRKATYLELYPETGHGMRNGQTSKNETISSLKKSSFTDSTAEKTNQSKRTIEQNIQIAAELEEYMEVLQNLPIADHKRELLELARINKEDKDIGQKIIAALKADPDANFKTVVADKIRETKRDENIQKLEDISAKRAKALVGVFDVIVYDPPWPSKKIERHERPNQSGLDYPTLTEEELLNLSIPAADDCHLWVWTTHKYFPLALEMIKSWGFKYVCIFTWHKPGGFQPVGLPQYNSEFAIYARKGTPKFIDTKAFPVCFSADRGKHSEKPQEFYDMVKRVTAGRRLDMFSRRKIEGFEAWGNEAISD